MDALANQAVSFATLPINQILGEASYLNELRTRGYDITGS